MYTEKEIKRLHRDYKKDKTGTLKRILVDYGKDLHTANGRAKAIDAIMGHYVPLSRSIVCKVEYENGYRLSGDWLIQAIAQIVPAEATCRMFESFNLDISEALFPNILPEECRTSIDFSSALNQPEGSNIIRSKLIPISIYPDGCTLESSSGNRYELSTVNDDGTYKIIAFKQTNGMHREYNITYWQLRKMKRVFL